MAPLLVDKVNVKKKYIRTLSEGDTVSLDGVDVNVKFVDRFTRTVTIYKSDGEEEISALLHRRWRWRMVSNKYIVYRRALSRAHHQILLLRILMSNVLWGGRTANIHSELEVHRHIKI